MITVGAQLWFRLPFTNLEKELNRNLYGIQKFSNSWGNQVKYEADFLNFRIHTLQRLLNNT